MSTIEDVLGPAPTGAGDQLGAIAYLAMINSTILNLKGKRWSKSRRSYLLKLRKRWEARVAGVDLRWNKVGIRAGRLHRGVKVRALRAPREKILQEDEPDPLLDYFINAEAKYGRRINPYGE